MDDKQAEERLREYQRVVEALGEMIVVIDRQYRYVLANRAFLDYRGLAREQVLGQMVWDIWGMDVFHEIKERLDQAFQGESVRGERRYTFPGRGERQIATFYFPIDGPAGIKRVACIVEDVTELRRTEHEREILVEALQASNKQLQIISNRLVEVQEEERQRLASEIHHQINQTLTELMAQLQDPNGVPATAPILSYRELSPREHAVLRFIAEGRTNKEIANDLSLSVRTVERHRSSLMSKLGLRTRAELVALAVRHSIESERE